MEAMSRYPRYPYQSTTISNNAVHTHQHQQLGAHQNHQHQPLRNPWVASHQQQQCESQSTNSSSSSRTYRGGGGGGQTAMWHQPSDHGMTNHHPRPAYQDQHHTVEVMVDGPGRLLLHPPSTGPAPTIVRYSSSSRAASDRDRPITPASSPGGHSGGRAAVDGCGGHCVAFETFCYYCLQVIFIAGILSGVSLLIAGSVLRSQQRGGDLRVLAYIGCLMAMVCTLLLSVQCCVRRNVKRRKRTLRRVGQRRMPLTAPPTGVEIPMQDMSALKVLQGQPMTRSDLTLVGNNRQYQPLLMHIVQQQQQTSNTTVAVDTLPRQQQYHHSNNYRSGNTTDTSGFVGRMMDVSRSGTPWWRRNAEMDPRMAESRH